MPLGKKAEPAALAERGELLHDPRPGLGAVGFEVDEEDEGLGGVGVEDAVGGSVVEFGVGVLPGEDLDQGVDVEGLEGAVGLESGLVVSDEEVVVAQPDVCLDARAACVEGGEKGDFPPVVVVGVAGYWQDVPEKVGRIPCEVLSAGARLAPVSKGVVLTALTKEMVGYWLDDHSQGIQRSDQRLVYMRCLFVNGLTYDTISQKRTRSDPHHAQSTLDVS